MLSSQTISYSPTSPAFVQSSVRSLSLSLQLVQTLTLLVVFFRRSPWSGKTRFGTYSRAGTSHRYCKLRLSYLLTPRGILLVIADIGFCWTETSFAIQTSYTFAFALVNVTLLILYVRIFPLPTLHKVCYGIGAFSVIWCLVNEIVLFVQCVPVRKFWNPTVEGHCINQNILYSVAGFICLVNILVIYCIPLPVIMKLQVNRSRKWAYSIAFTVGSL